MDDARVGDTIGAAGVEGLEVLHGFREVKPMVFSGLYPLDAEQYESLKEALDGFVDTTQKLVTGDVRLRFFKGSCVVVGRRSPYSLYDYDLATYDATDTFDHTAAKGFVQLWGLPTKVWARQRRKVGKDGEV